MANRSGETFLKREKEKARQEKQREKMQRRLERNQRRKEEDGPGGPPIESIEDDFEGSPESNDSDADPDR
jgi:hypothetical protein